MSKKINKLLPELIGLGIVFYLVFKNNIKAKEIFIWIIVGFVSLILLHTLLQYALNVLERKKYLKSGLAKIDKMTGIQFERFLKAHFESLGYKVTLTPASNDYGADLILKKDGEKIAVQAKRYNGKVNNKAVQEIAAAMGYYKCNKGMVVTNSFYTSNAVNLAKECKIELWDRNVLKEKFKVV